MLTAHREIINGHFWPRSPVFGTLQVTARSNGHPPGTEDRRDAGRYRARRPPQCLHTRGAPEMNIECEQALKFDQHLAEPAPKAGHGLLAIVA
jgi:hypothetical protein